MMTSTYVLKHTINMAHDILTTYLGDLEDADLLLRPVSGMNHIAWQLGHLIASEHKMMTDAGFTMPGLPDGFAESYTKETSGSDDAAKFLGKDEYLQCMGKQREATLKHLEAAADADLTRPSPESIRAYAPTIGALFSLIGMHTMMHAAQFVAVRRKLSKPVTI